MMDRIQFTVVRSHSTRCEAMCGKALISPKLGKVKARLQGFLAEFTKSTKKDAKEYMNSALFELIEVALRQ
jgi:hypothetical protein